MASACSPEAMEMSSIYELVLSESLVTSFIVAAVVCAIVIPFPTASIVAPINSPVCCAASALFAARLPTSSATTAKPFPASPALAASTAALSASMLVWKAISSIDFIMFCISSDLFLISSIA